MKERWFIRVAFLILLTVTSPGSAGADQELPDKIISGYNGWFAPNADDAENQLESIVEQSLDPLSKNGFTAYHIKIQGANKEIIDLSNPVQMKRVRQLAEAAAGRDLELLTYVYDSVNHGKRNPDAHSEYPPVVRNDGTVVEDQFSLIHYPTWKFLFTEAFELARASKELPIASVQIDVERVQPGMISYDDRAWKRFAGEHEVDPDTTREQRKEELDKQNLSGTYKKWYRNQMNRVAKRFEEELHRINPDLSLGIMPTKRSWVIWPFVRHLGTERAPAVIDHWGMYNGGGLARSVLKAQKAVRNANSHNRFVPWFRPDSYRPEDIRVQAYHAIRKTDGYSLWHLGMMADSQDSSSLPGSYTGDDYYQAFGEANRKAKEDLSKDGQPVSIPFEEPESIAAELPDEVIDRVKVPRLEPAGDGSGRPTWFFTRERRVFYVHARAGDQLRMDVRHLAGQARPRSLQYAVIDRNHNRLRQEAVAPGKTQSFAVNAPHTGTYALVITGGAGGQAWYGVRIHNNHVAMAADSPVTNNRARLYMTGSARKNSVHLFLTRTDPEKEAAVHVGTGRGQTIAAKLNNRSEVQIEDHEKSLTLPKNRTVHRLRISRPDEVPEGLYVQGVLIRVSGAVSPYLSDHPSRRLLPGSGKNR